MRRGDYIEFVSTPILDGASAVDFTGLELKASIRQASLVVYSTVVSGDALGVVTAIFSSDDTKRVKAGPAQLQVQVIDGQKKNIIIDQSVTFGPSNFLR